MPVRNDLLVLSNPPSSKVIFVCEACLLSCFIDEKVRVINTGTGVIIAINDKDENVQNYLRSGAKLDIGNHFLLHQLFLIEV
jgi:hypothetical protein